jgi:hypothetical protein
MNKGMSTLVVGIILSSVVGCKDREACEKSRLELARAWTNVNEGAARIKMMGAEELSSDGERKAHMAQWEKIEKETSLLQSAFQSAQVTWDSAQASLGDLHGLLGQVTGSESTKIFENSIENAEADTQAYEQACR